MKEECIRIPVRLKKREEKFLRQYLEIDESGFMSERIKARLVHNPRHLREKPNRAGFKDEESFIQYWGSRTNVIAKIKDVIVRSDGVLYIYISKFSFDIYMKNYCSEKRRAHKVYATPHFAYALAPPHPPCYLMGFLLNISSKRKDDTDDTEMV